jgi:hypothetical protein
VVRDNILNGGGQRMSFFEGSQTVLARPSGREVLSRKGKALGSEKGKGLGRDFSFKQYLYLVPTSQETLSLR